MSGYVKIYGSIIRSTVWQQPAPTKLVWLTMLILADSKGVVESSIPGLASIAGVSLDECEAALLTFLSPDKYSHSKEDEGRRIRDVDGGWFIINHGLYREKRTEKQVADAERLAARRNATCSNVATDPYPSSDPDPSSDPIRIAAPAAPPKPKRPKRGPLWHFAPEDWKPAGKVLTDTQALLGPRFFAELTKFREWEFRDGKSDPDRAWRRWARKALEDGNAPRGALAPRGGPDRADNGWRPDQRHRTLLERLGRPSAELDRMAGEFIRTGAIGALVGEQADRAFAEFIRGKAGAK